MQASTIIFCVIQQCCQRRANHALADVRSLVGMAKGSSGTRMEEPKDRTWDASRAPWKRKENGMRSRVGDGMVRLDEGAVTLVDLAKAVDKYSWWPHGT